MRVPKQFATVITAAAVAGVVSFGAGAMFEAGASGPSVTYQACLSPRGGLSKVSATVTPTCPLTSHVISFNSQGQQGQQGAPGVNGTQGGVGAGCLFKPATGTVDWHDCIQPNLALDNFDLTGADLSGADLSSATLTGATLSGANLSGVHMSGANLVGVTSGGITGTPTDWPSGFLLVDGYIIGPLARLSGANLSGANLTNANLYAANLTGANLSGANLSGVIWSSTICPDGTNTWFYLPQTCIGHGI